PRASGLADLSPTVPPPALHGAVRQQRAGVVATGAGRNRRQTKPIYRNRRRRRRPVARAELAVIIASPTVQRAVGHQRTIVIAARCQRGDGAEAYDLARPGGVRRPVAVAGLPVLVAS